MMIDNTKEYIVCAAYRQSKNTSNRRKVINDIGKDPKSIYYAPHNEVFDLRLGYRHTDIKGTICRQNRGNENCI